MRLPDLYKMGSRKDALSQIQRSMTNFVAAVVVVVVDTVKSGCLQKQKELQGTKTYK